MTHAQSMPRVNWLNKSLAHCAVLVIGWMTHDHLRHNADELVTAHCQQGARQEHSNEVFPRTMSCKAAGLQAAAACVLKNAAVNTMLLLEISLGEEGQQRWLCRGESHSLLCLKALAWPQLWRKVRGLLPR